MQHSEKLEEAESSFFAAVQKLSIFSINMSKDFSQEEADVWHCFCFYFFRAGERRGSRHSAPSVGAHKIIGGEIDG